MGCGCKGSKQETPKQEGTTVQSTNQTTKTLSETIKKTVEKYYQKNKPS
jgi:hypothetical protein